MVDAVEAGEEDGGGKSAVAGKVMGRLRSSAARMEDEAQVSRTRLSARRAGSVI